MGFSLNKKRRSTYLQAKPTWGIANVMRGIDGFGQDIPAFNLKGESRVNTVLGGFCTVLIIFLSLTFAAVKAIHLYERSGPTINQGLDVGYFSQSDVVRFNDVGFRFAFTVSGLYDRKNKLDPRYTKWIVRLVGRTDGQDHETILPFRKCTDEDYDKFYPIDPNQKDRLDILKNDPEAGLFCVDITDDFEMFGNWDAQDFASVAIDLVPCNYLHTYMGYKDDTISDECIRSKEAQLEFLGPLMFQMLINHSSFNQDGYGENAVLRTSKLIYQQANASVPSYIDFQGQVGELSDETDFFQYGQEETQDFFGYTGTLTPQPSGWIDYPTPEKPLGKYKFIGLDFNLNKDLMKVSRSTYSILEWFGDVGGLIDGLFLLVELMVSPLAGVALQATLATQVVRLYPQVSIKNPLRTPEKIHLPFHVELIWDCVAKSKRQRMMERAHSKIERELDLAKFINSRRTQLRALFALLTVDQASAIEGVSALAVHEDSSESSDLNDEWGDPDSGSNSEIDEETLQKSLDALKKSHDPTDIRFKRIIRLMGKRQGRNLISRNKLGSAIFVKGKVHPPPAKRRCSSDEQANDKIRLEPRAPKTSPFDSSVKALEQGELNEDAFAAAQEESDCPDEMSDTNRSSTVQSNRQLLIGRKPSSDNRAQNSVGVGLPYATRPRRQNKFDLDGEPVLEKSAETWQKPQPQYDPVTSQVNASVSSETFFVERKALHDSACPLSPSGTLFKLDQSQRPT